MQDSHPDGTDGFDDAGHSEDAHAILKKYYKGELDPKDAGAAKKSSAAASGSDSNNLMIIIVLVAMAVGGFIMMGDES